MLKKKKMYLSYDTKIAIILGQTGTETETVYLSLSLSSLHAWPS